MEREFDVAVIGATGFSGQLICEHFARSDEYQSLRWCVAARSASKLAALKASLSAIRPSLAALPHFVISIEGSDADVKSLDGVVSRSSVVLNCIGPFALYGEPVVKSCIKNSTHYCDISGEPSYLNRLVEKYHQLAILKNVAVVPCCGFDSVVADMGVHFALREMKSASSPPDSLESVMDFTGGKVGLLERMSSGTFRTWIQSFADASSAPPAAAKKEEEEEEEKKEKKTHCCTLPRFDPEVKKWILPVHVADPYVVRRSFRLQSPADAPQMGYSQFHTVKSLCELIVLMVFFHLMMIFTRFPPMKRWMASWKAEGSGPSEEIRKKTGFAIHVRSPDMKNRFAVTGPSPYDATAICAAAAAASMALDAELPRAFATGGVLTPSTAMGDALLKRLQRNGLTFAVVAHPKKD